MTRSWQEAALLYDHTDLDRCGSGNENIIFVLLNVEQCLTNPKATRALSPKNLSTYISATCFNLAVTPLLLLPTDSALLANAPI